MGVLMKRSLWVHPLLAAAFLAAPTLAAQRPGGVEIGAFGSLGSFTPRFDLQVGTGGGGRIGYFLGPTWEIELEGSVERATVEGGGKSIPLTLAGVHALYNFGDDRRTFYLIGGYARPQFRGTPPGRFSDNAAVLGVGGRMFLGYRFAVRTDIRGLYTFSSHLPPTRGAGHMLVTAGFTYFTIGGPASDGDADGVADSRDACPLTPPGATVDRKGCPSDSDSDGHFDGLDRCPDTPLGAFADSRGCPVDSDGDGVFDGFDQCANTPGGLPVDVRGCPRDSDGDGVDDGNDRCPNTPAATPVDETGCPRDGDKDGVHDGLDRCPGTATGVAVDAVGCPIATDSDGDGVDDSRDRCPGTPAGTPVDVLGCQILFRNDREALVLYGVTFVTGRSRLEEDSYGVLDQVAASLVANPAVRIEVAGYTDSTGSTARNTRLSAARALAVRAYLARRGVAPDRMQTKGYGPANPVASNATPEGRAQNRRVELHQLF
jgi:outer membrane protein OmpA-like peptidoglycan-associated protein